MLHLSKEVLCARNWMAGAEEVGFSHVDNESFPCES
jgi:hypothetical protein